tara:strand:- start:3942 stop:5216 length:1275 start_codon:yes stop_codon:yes gene_type:complete
MNPSFSIVVPTLDNLDDLEKLIISINSQTLLPKEVVISDSSSSNQIEEAVKIIHSKVPIVYLRVGRAFKLDRFLKSLSFLPFFNKIIGKLPDGRAFPYEASNAAVEKAAFEWIAFLDATTIPAASWLEDYWNFKCQYECDVVFGNTRYFAKTKFQKLLRASTYGRIGHETAPGSIIKKVNFLNGLKIMEGVRSGGDVAWKMKIKDSLNYYLPSKSYLSYSSLPNSLLLTLKKFFTYQIYGSFIDIQNNIKDLYLGTALLLCIILIPKWNYIVGWDSIFFIPHITKIFFLSLFLIIFISFTINRVFFRVLALNSFRANSLKLLLFIIIAYSIFNWNAVVAKWVEDSIWYIPHITKIFVFLVFTASFVYRGIYFPLKNKIRFSYLFPFRWFLVGVLGILLDLAKAPGYLLGAILASFVRRAKNIHG